MIWLLLVVCVFLLYVSYVLNNHEFYAPSSLFCISFCYSIIWACAYAGRYNLQLHFNTFSILAGGLILYILTSELVKRIYKKNVYHNYGRLQNINIGKGRIILFVGIEILTVFLSFFFVLSAGLGRGISETIYAYRVSEITVVYPWYLSIARVLVNAGGYWFAYVCANNTICLGKIESSSLVVVILSVLNDIMTGGRGEIINKLIALIGLYLILYFWNKHQSPNINIEKFIKIILLLLIFLILFEKLGGLLGRSSLYSGFDYIAMYSGAEIKNLDTFLQENYTKPRIWGCQTFKNFIVWLGTMFNRAEWIYDFDLKLRFSNGFSLGNVATQYYSFVYDFGYTGVVWLTMLMALLSESVFQLAKRRITWQNGTVSLTMVIYGAMIGPILFSFFSNKFYEQIFAPAFFKYIPIWIIFEFLFCKIKIKFGKIRNI